MRSGGLGVFALDQLASRAPKEINKEKGAGPDKMNCKNKKLMLQQ